MNGKLSLDKIIMAERRKYSVSLRKQVSTALLGKTIIAGAKLIDERFAERKKIERIQDVHIREDDEYQVVVQGRDLKWYFLLNDNKITIVGE